MTDGKTQEPNNAKPVPGPGETSGPEESKIFVDEDWKSQAQAEKQRLANEPAGPAGGADAARGVPEASFATLVSSIVTQVLFALGAIEDPQTRQRYRDLPMAKHQIDMLAILEQKTQGNLTDEEKKLLDNALYEVRMAYVQVAQAG